VIDISIKLLGLTSGGSRHSVVGKQFNMFPSISCLFFVGGGQSL